MLKKNIILICAVAVLGIGGFVLTAEEAGALTHPCCVGRSGCQDASNEVRCTNESGRWDPDCSSRECNARREAEEAAERIVCCYNSATHRCQEIARPSDPCPSGLNARSWVSCSDASMDAICRPPPPPPPAAPGCCIPSCTESAAGTCATDGDSFMSQPCSENPGGASCVEVEVPAAPPPAGESAPAGTQCCVSSTGCQEPTPDTNRCLIGSPDSQPCSAITVCTTVERLRTTPPPAPTPSSVELPNPLGTTDFYEIIGRIIKVLMGAAGTLGLLMFVYGGFHWLTAGGNAEKIKKGRDIVLWSVLGIALMFSAYIVSRYVIEILTRGTTQ